MCAITTLFCIWMSRDIFWFEIWRIYVIRFGDLWLLIFTSIIPLSRLLIVQDSRRFLSAASITRLCINILLGSSSWSVILMFLIFGMFITRRTTILLSEFDVTAWRLFWFALFLACSLLWLLLLLSFVILFAWRYQREFIFLVFTTTVNLLILLSCYWLFVFK